MFGKKWRSKDDEKNSFPKFMFIVWVRIGIVWRRKKTIRTNWLLSHGSKAGNGAFGKCLCLGPGTTSKQACVLLMNVLLFVDLRTIPVLFLPLMLLSLWSTKNGLEAWIRVHTRRKNTKESHTHSALLNSLLIGRMEKSLPKQMLRRRSFVSSYWYFNIHFRTDNGMTFWGGVNIKEIYRSFVSHPLFAQLTQYLFTKP